MAALGIARLVLDAFFEGDPAEWREQGSDHEGFRALLHDDRLESSTTTIWYALGVLEQCQEMPDDLALELSLAHHRLLLPVDDHALKLSLARKAIRYSWSKRRLATAIRGAVDVPSRGRPRAPAFVKAGRSLRKGLAATLAEPVQLEAIHRFGVDRARRALHELRADLRAMLDLTEHLEDCLDEADRDA